MARLVLSSTLKRRNNAYPTRSWVGRSLKIEMLNSSELDARHFPLWKRGTKGDLQTSSNIANQNERLAAD